MKTFIYSQRGVFSEPPPLSRQTAWRGIKCEAPRGRGGFNLMSLIQQTDVNGTKAPVARLPNDGRDDFNRGVKINNRHTRASSTSAASAAS